MSGNQDSGEVYSGNSVTGVGSSRNQERQTKIADGFKELEL
jgi:hypothetical protein